MGNLFLKTMKKVTTYDEIFNEQDYNMIIKKNIIKKRCIIKQKGKLQLFSNNSLLKSINFSFGK